MPYHIYRIETLRLGDYKWRPVHGATYRDDRTYTHGRTATQVVTRVLATLRADWPGDKFKVVKLWHS